MGFSLINAAPIDSLRSGEPTHIHINNRILAKVNGKSISTYDVAKKMDMLFYSQYPEYLSSVGARFQYYQAHWKAVFEELIHKELVLADAEEHKVVVSSGDVRQEMESLFGPSIIENLDKAGMTFDEASKIVQGDILIRRMINMKVNVKALRVVTPSKIRQTYDEFASDPKNATHNKWRYQVVTIRDRTTKKAEDNAKIAYQMLVEEKIPLDKLSATMKEKKLFGRKGSVNVSEEILNNEQELSSAYKEILSGMSAGMISQPSAHKSRGNNATVYRIFYVKEKIPGGVPSYQEMENTIKEKLLNDTADNETDAYLKKLRQHFHIRDEDLQATIPSNYQPFVLK
ncbi:MAG: SurA N-terminal domain-containing protein [Parachlamydiaceae bacterium]|nr:SurA N-terminal domain-containing protein [Parachlamydiaceae bacterium]